jgi:hypothetical protein
MRKSIAVKPKKRGRPATGKDPFVGVRLPDEMIEAVDGWADKNGTTRSAAIRQFIEQGLSATPHKPAEVPAEPASLWPMPTDVEQALANKPKRKK